MATIRIISVWAYEEIYDYPVDELPEGWDDMDISDKAKYAYENLDAFQVACDPLHEIELTDVEVI